MSRAAPGGARPHGRQWIKFAKRYAVGAAGAAYAFTAGVASGRHRELIRGVASHFGFDGGLPRRLPMVSVDAVTASSTSIALAELTGQNGNVSLLELIVLARLVRERAPRQIMELGTFDGRTTLALAMNAPDATVYTLDLPSDAPTTLGIQASERVYVDKPTPGARFRGSAHASRIVQLLGDTAVFDFAPYAAQFVFVDASHAYEYILNDSARALDVIGDEAGMIVWHDYGEWDGVTLGLEHLARTDGRFAGLRWVEGTTLAVLDVPGKPRRGAGAGMSEGR